MKKYIGLGGVFSIATGAMISSGIFILPSLAFARLGPPVSLAYLIAGVFALLGSFSIIELATAMPKAGGDYYYIHKTFGGFLGSISGIFGWFALSLKSAFAIVGISEVLFRFFPLELLAFVPSGLGPSISGVLLCAVFILLNAIGAKEAVTLQNLLVFLLLVLLVAYSAAGIAVGIYIAAENNLANLGSDGGDQPLGLWHSLQQGFPLENISSLGNLAVLLNISGFVFVSFGGLLKVTNVSEEIYQLKRNLPLGMGLAISVVTFLYVLINVILVGVMPPETLKNSLAPVADSAQLIMQGWGELAANAAYYTILLASLLAFITTANAGIMAAARYPMALSRDKLLPPGLAKLHPRYQTPLPSLLLTGLIVTVALFLPLETLVKAASAAVLSSYILTNLALIIFRESKVINYRPSFSAPLYPWLQIICIAVFGFFIVDIGTQAIEVSIFFLALGVLVYYFYGRKHGSKSFALVYLLRRIVDRHLSRDSLEDELLDLLLHRDEVKLNVFQELASKAAIFDLPYAVTFANMLKVGSKTLAAEVGLAPDLLEQRFLARQAEGTTALTGFLAIPHFITADESDLCMQIVRCNEGVFFDEAHPKVQAIFLLCGGPERRREHLECLAAIATMVGEIPNFAQCWLSAANTSELRHLILDSAKPRQVYRKEKQIKEAK